MQSVTLKHGIVLFDAKCLRALRRRRRPRRVNIPLLFLWNDHSANGAALCFSHDPGLPDGGKMAKDTSATTRNIARANKEVRKKYTKAASAALAKVVSLEGRKDIRGMWLVKVRRYSCFDIGKR